MSKNKVKYIGFELKENLNIAFEKLLKKEGYTISEFLREQIRKRLKESNIEIGVNLG